MCSATRSPAARAARSMSGSRAASADPAPTTRRSRSGRRPTRSRASVPARPPLGRGVEPRAWEPVRRDRDRWPLPFCCQCSQAPSVAAGAVPGVVEDRHLPAPPPPGLPGLAVRELAAPVTSAAVTVAAVRNHTVLRNPRETLSGWSAEWKWQPPIHRDGQRSTAAIRGYTFPHAERRHRRRVPLGLAAMLAAVSSLRARIRPPAASRAWRSCAE